MRRNRLTKPIRMIAGLLTGLIIAILAVPLSAQPVAKAQPGRGFGPAYDAAHETILKGTIQEVVTKHTVGSPAGMHLLVAGPHGVVDAHVGPFLSKETKESLRAGMPVQIVGAMSAVRGRNYLLVRTVNVAGRTVTVRGQHGALVRAQSTRPGRSRTENKNSKTTQKGESL
jgi:hypothetical protein